MQDRIQNGRPGSYASEGMDDPVTRREAELIAAAVVEGTLAAVLGTRTTGAVAHGEQLRRVIDGRARRVVATNRLSVRLARWARSRFHPHNWSAWECVVSPDRERRAWHRYCLGCVKAGVLVAQRRSEAPS